MGGSIISTLKMIFAAEAALPVSASTAGLAFTVRLIIAALLAPQKADVVLNKLTQQVWQLPFGSRGDELRSSSF